MVGTFFAFVIGTSVTFQACYAFNKQQCDEQATEYLWNAAHFSVITKKKKNVKKRERNKEKQKWNFQVFISLVLFRYWTDGFDFTELLPMYMEIKYVLLIKMQ